MKSIHNHRRPTRTALAALLAPSLSAALLLIGCSADPLPSSARGWEGTVAREGKITTVRTAGGSVWGTAGLVEEASIGTLDGEDPYVFSRIRSVAASAERTYVADSMANAVRVYDASGAYLMDLGRPGDGPGELRQPWAVGLVGSRVFIRDRTQGRVHVFSPAGELLEDFRVTGAARTTFSRDGVVWVHNWIPGLEGPERRLGMIAYGAAGRGPVIPIPEFPSEGLLVPVDQSLMEPGYGAAMTSGLSIDPTRVPFAPSPVWSLSPDATMVSGVPDAYRFEMARRDGSVTVVEKRWEPIPVDPEEALWYRERLVALWRLLIPEFVWVGADVPAHKRAYADLFPDQNGRVWALRELAGKLLPGCDPRPADLDGFIERPCWRQPHALEAFDGEGRFLGQVSIPDRMRFDVQPFIDGDIVVAVFEDAAGTLIVKRFRLQTDA